MTTHTFEDKSFGIGHSTANDGADCGCGATRNVKYIGRSSGRGGSHQGYRTEVTVAHKAFASTETK